MAVNTLISPTRAKLLDNAVFVDCRFNLADPAAGQTAYDADHIPGARYADLDKDLSGEIIPGVTGRHPLPEQDDLIHTIRTLGISNDQPVVAYDSGNGAHAARLWWLLRSLGHGEVWVMDGGLASWCNQGLPTTDEIPTVATTDFEARDSLCLYLDAEAVSTSTRQICDARDLERYQGKHEPIDPVAGHIPGALCLPFVNNLTPEGTFKQPELLHQQFQQAGIHLDQPVVCYCGSGVTACHNILALRHAGYPEPYLYPGSWSEWITDPSRPVATG